MLNAQTADPSSTASTVDIDPSSAPGSKAGSDDRVPVVPCPPFVARLLPVCGGSADSRSFPPLMRLIFLLLWPRKSHQDALSSPTGELGFMSFFVKAVVHALKAVPGLNANGEEQLVEHHYYDIGVAVGTERLVVPVLRDCDQMTFAEIEQGIVGFAEKARSGYYSSGHAGDVLPLPMEAFTDPCCPLSSILLKRHFRYAHVRTPSCRNGEIVARHDVPGTFL